MTFHHDDIVYDLIIMSAHIDVNHPILQLCEVLTVDDDSPVKFSSEVLFYVDKYEIV